MICRPNRIALAISCAFASAALPVQAEETNKTLNPVIVTADPLGSGESAMILAPAKVLSGTLLICSPLPADSLPTDWRFLPLADRPRTRRPPNLGFCMTEMHG